MSYLRAVRQQSDTQAQRKCAAARSCRVRVDNDGKSALSSLCCHIGQDHSSKYHQLCSQSRHQRGHSSLVNSRQEGSLSIAYGGSRTLTMLGFPTNAFGNLCGFQDLHVSWKMYKRTKQLNYRFPCIEKRHCLTQPRDMRLPFFQAAHRRKWCHPKLLDNRRIQSSFLLTLLTLYQFSCQAFALGKGAPFRDNPNRSIYKLID